jgi:hypothetical protein
VNPDAKPDNTDANEKPMVAATSISLRRPNRLTRVPMRNPAIAQLKEKPETILPIWKLLRCRSGCMNDVR